MSKPSYISLHNHCTYSFQDGIGSVEEWVTGAKAKGLAGLAMTDHGDCSSMLELYEMGKKHNFPVILGCEFYFALTTEKVKEDRYSHLIIWAKNEVGYKNLCKLSHCSFQEKNFYYKPRITIDDLTKHKEGLIVSSACVNGPFSAYKDIGEAEYVLEKFIHLFGDDLYLEIQSALLTHDWDGAKGKFVEVRGDEMQSLNNKRMVELAKKYNLKLLATPDAHMVDAQNKIVQDIQLMNLFKNQKHYYETYFLPTREEFFQQFAMKHPYLSAELVNEALDNTHEILEKCKDLKLNFGYKLPQAESRIEKVLEKVIEKGIVDLKNPVYQERMRTELEVIVSNGTLNLLPYFMVLEDLVTWCRKHGVLVGPGRGSAAGSLFAYSLGITQIDPIKYDLPFGRFLNLSRVKKGALPDIDLDFSDPQAAKDYLVHKYGADHVLPISVTQTFKARSALKDVIRVLDPNLPAATANKYSQMIEYSADGDQKELIQQALIKSPELQTYLIDKRPDVLNAFIRLVGQCRQRGTHPAAVVMSSEPIHHIVPVCKSKTDGGIITQYTMKWCERAGLVKNDILGLSTLKVIQDCVKEIKDHKDIHINPYKIDMEDQKIFKEFENGNTDTVFQFKEDFVKDMLRRSKITSVNDLATITALGRPGPMNMKVYESFINRSQGLEQISYPHPALRGTLEKTLGILCYQEQVMEAVKILGNFTNDEADDVRRAMGKKQTDVLDKYKAKFIDYATAHYSDITIDRANSIWDLIYSFGRYGFNKAHAISYSVLAYICMWLKTYYPLEWWSAVVSNETEADKIRFYYYANKNIFEMPDINASLDRCRIVDGKIILPLTLVTKVGEQGIKEIIKKKAYISFKDFYDRVNARIVNKGVIINLIFADAFRKISGLGNKELIKEYYHLLMASRTLSEKTKLLKEYENEYDTLNRFQIIQKKAEACTVYEPNYVEQFKNCFKNEVTSLEKIEAFADRRFVHIGGVIDTYKELDTKKQEKMAFLDLANNNKTIKLTVFPETYSLYRDQISRGKQLVEVSGRVNRWKGKFSVVVENMDFLITE